MVPLIILVAIAAPAAVLGVSPALHAWPAAVSGAVIALILSAPRFDAAARKKAAADYQEQNDGLAARSAAMIAEYHEVMAGVHLQQSIDRRDRRDLQEERQRHGREVRELQAALSVALERIQRMQSRQKKQAKPENDEE